MSFALLSKYLNLNEQLKYVEVVIVLFVDQEARATVKIFESEKESINANKSYTIHTHITHPLLQLSPTLVNSTLINRKWGDSHWILQSQTIENESIMTLKGYYLIITRAKSGVIEINNQKHDVIVEHNVFFNSNLGSFSNGGNMWDSLAFRLSIFDTPIADNRSITSEIFISTYVASNDLLSYIFVAISIFL